jgi:hypothetical protein
MGDSRRVLSTTGNLEEAAVREARRSEPGGDPHPISHLFRPLRDPRHHSISTVLWQKPWEHSVQDDALEIGVFDRLTSPRDRTDRSPSEDYFNSKEKVRVKNQGRDQAKKVRRLRSQLEE